MTLKQFKENINYSGVSVVAAAYIAMSVTDDDELRERAKELIRRESEFDIMLDEREISRS